MNDIILRPATPADLAGIQPIYAEAVVNGTGSFELEPPDHAEMTRRMEKLLDGGFPYFVALDSAGRLLGYAYAGPYHYRPGYRFTLEDSVYVDPMAHGRGVGRALLERLIDEATRHGYRQMIAVIGDTANAGSIALHRRLGFHDVGTLGSVAFKHGRWLDSVLMQRGLGEADGSDPA